jgi:cyclopropane-fatty-acyl-phospholipid synthase
VALTSEGRARVWRLYMSASALAFEDGKLGINQVLLQKPGGTRPPLRRDWT